VDEHADEGPEFHPQHGLLFLLVARPPTRV
jgi:hypothetical protein